MQVGPLFNPGILGGEFNWWMGQVMDDSSWRDNINDGKFEDKNAIPGWGYRYKVRIMGVHPQEEEILKTEEIPWATLMYPVTGGGGQSASFQTPQIRQGNFVFGYFMDGGQQQVPVIMGVLGNNAQTELQTKTGLTGGKNYKAQSGYAESAKPKGNAQESPPDSDIGIVNPKSPLEAVEAASLKKALKNLKGGLGSFTISGKSAIEMGLLPGSNIQNMMGGLKEMSNTMAPQLKEMSNTMVPQLQNIANQFDLGGGE